MTSAPLCQHLLNKMRNKLGAMDRQHARRIKRPNWFIKTAQMTANQVDNNNMYSVKKMVLWTWYDKVISSNCGHWINHKDTIHLHKKKLIQFCENTCHT